jgi:aminoglycoside phosphotransferase family enzyme/predicted kinase
MDQRQLVTVLRNPLVYGHDVHEVTLVETHISYVLLTGRHAYKIKKAVDFGFLNFTTLSARRFYCEEELRLNRRLAPDIYLGVVRITGSVEAPAIDGDGPVLEYAVKMRQFDQEGLLSRVIARGALIPSAIDALAAEVASFHRRTAGAGADAPFGRPDDILQPALQNFEQMLAIVDDARDRSDLQALLEGTRQEHRRLAPVFLTRRRDGFVRECHGDLHLGNIALIEGAMTLFDCIEFNESMRWTDVMSDIAFLVMDLGDRNRPDLAARFLTAYLEITGDYEGLGVLRFYVAYRALVRAKVACLRLGQAASGEERDRSLAEYHTYVNLALRETGPHQPAIAITHGVTGSGKTTSSQAFVESVGAVRVRSDVERKRLHGLGAGERSGSAVGEGLYAADATRQTYARLSMLARTIAAAGYVAIVDAAFLKRWQRDLLRNVATSLKVPFVILDCSAPAAVLRERVARRLQQRRDASEATLAVLEQQLSTADPLAEEETSETLRTVTASSTGQSQSR